MSNRVHALAQLFKVGESFNYVGTTYTITHFGTDGSVHMNWSHRVGGPLPLPTDATVASFMAAKRAPADSATIPDLPNPLPLAHIV